MNQPIELPSLQEIEEMDRQRQKAMESLEISNDRKAIFSREQGQPLVFM